MTGGSDEKSVEAYLSRFHAGGWRVAVHNDYEQGGKLHTFWLLTNREIGVFAKGEGDNDVEALDAATREANERVSFFRDIARRANAGNRLAQRVIAELRLTTRWPCPECGRSGPQDALRMIQQQIVDPATRKPAPNAKVVYTGCVRCNEHDRLVALAEEVLNVTPPRRLTPTVYTVKEGDTLSGIAQRHGVLGPDAYGGALVIARANGIEHPDHIRVGQKLIIPVPEG